MNLKQITQIAEGYLKEGLKSFLPKEDKELAEKRMHICVQCPLFDKGTCNPNKKIKNKEGLFVNGCGCNMKKKVFCKECSCPAQKW